MPVFIYMPWRYLFVTFRRSNLLFFVVLLYLISCLDIRWEFHNLLSVFTSHLDNLYLLCLVVLCCFVWKEHYTFLNAAATTCGCIWDTSALKVNFLWLHFYHFCHTDSTRHALPQNIYNKFNQVVLLLLPFTQCNQTVTATSTRRQSRSYLVSLDSKGFSCELWVRGMTRSQLG